jgi:hypothetical protein
MPPEIFALIEKPLLLIAILLVGAITGMTVERFLSKGTAGMAGNESLALAERMA